MKVPAWMKGSCIRVIVECLCAPGQMFLGGSSPTSRRSQFAYLSGGDCSPWPNCLGHGHEWRAREPPVQPKLTMAPSLSPANAGKYTGLCVGGRGGAGRTLQAADPYAFWTEVLTWASTSLEASAALPSYFIKVL